MVGVHEVSPSFPSPLPTPTKLSSNNFDLLISPTQADSDSEGTTSSHDLLGEIPPHGFLDRLPRSHQDRGDNVEAVKKRLENQKEEFCLACKEKWSSDIMNIENLDVYKLNAYLRAEFNSVIRKEVDKRLRDLEQAQVKTEEKLRNAENLEEELRNWKDKCLDLSVEIGRLEVIKSDTEIELYKKANEELREKLVYLDDVDRDRSEAFIELNKTCEELRERVSKLEEVNRCNSEELVELHKYKVECENLRKLEVELKCHDLTEKITHLEQIIRNQNNEVFELTKYKVDFDELRAIEVELNNYRACFEELKAHLDDAKREKEKALIELTKSQLTCDILRGKVSHLQQVTENRSNDELELFKVAGEKLPAMTAPLGTDRDKIKVQCSEASKAKTVVVKENENENCAPRLNELGEIRERNSLECQKSTHDNSACSTIKEKDTNKRRKCEGVIEQVDVGVKIAVDQETMKVKDALLEREKKIRCHERLEKQVGNITGKSAVKEVVKANSVSLEDRKRKGNSNHEGMEKHVEAKRTNDEVEKALKAKGAPLRITSGLLKIKLRYSGSIQPSSVEGPNRIVATLKGVEPETSHQPLDLPPVQDE